MKSAAPSVPSLVGRPLRAPDQVRARDWTVTFALLMGLASLVLMFMLFWL